MKPVQYVLLWIGEASLYIVVLVILFILMPEIKVYNLIRMYTGVIPGDTWDKFYFLFLCMSSLLIVSIVVYLTALIRKR